MKCFDCVHPALLHLYKILPYSRQGANVRMEVYYLVATVLLVAVDGYHPIKRQVIFNETPSEDNCKTPDGADGTCVRLFECKPLLSKLQENPSSEFIDFLKRSHCRFERNSPIVCCPDVVVGSAITSPSVTRTPETLPPVTKFTEPTTSFPESTLAPVTNSVLPRSCGITSSDSPRIVGGRKANKGSWPWLAALGYSSLNGRVDYLCGGALITSQHVLTAAHCVIGRRDLSVVRLGAHDLSDKSEETAEDVKIKKKTPHEAYSTSSFENDIAVLTLETPVDFKGRISPVCLPRGDFFRNNPLTSLQGFIAGWGAIGFNLPMSSVLLEAMVPIRTNEECKNSYSTFRNIVVDQRRLCAGSGNIDTCQGDSGGPIMIFDPVFKVYSVAGIVSVGFKCAEKEFPGIYTRVTSYMDWIEKNLN